MVPFITTLNILDIKFDVILAFYLIESRNSAQKRQTLTYYNFVLHQTLQNAASY